MSRSAAEVVEKLQAAGHVALLAGGCVRDIIMGRTPKDFDIATDASPDETVKLFPEAVTVGKSFGVVRVKHKGHWHEIATFRQDHAYKDGRRPEKVTFCDPETDAERRDFTVNALFFDPGTGTIHDYIGGQADIKARIIKAVGNPGDRFNEDYLRMLRAVRFAGTLDFKLEKQTFNAIKSCAGKISAISMERIRDELTRALTESARPGRILELLQELELLPVILPEVSAMKGQEQPPQFHPEGDVFTHTVIMLDKMEQPGPQLAYAILFHDIGKPVTARLDGDRLRFNGHAARGAEMTEKIMKRMKFSNNEIKTVSFCVGNHMRFMDVRKMRRATLRRLIGAPTFPVELELHKLDCIASHGDLSNYDFLVEYRKSFEEETKLPTPLISGKDVLDQGIAEGREIGKWKTLAYETQLDGKLKDREHALQWLKQAIKNSK